MAYVFGFLLAVPTDQKDAYRQHAAEAWPIFRDNGCLSICETWGVDVPDGKVTSFPMAVKLKEGETVVFSWMVWPDKDTADRGFAAMKDDPRMEKMSQPPFDGMRMMWGGFEELLNLDA